MRLKRFGGGRWSYDFPAQISFNPNFGDGVTQTQRLPGMDGGFDAYGDEPLPSEIGTLAVEWWLDTDAAVESITTLKSRAMQMNVWGRRPLWITPEDGSPLRWCSAKIDNIRMPENVKDVPHRRQKVSANIQVSYPRWQSKPAVVTTLNGGARPLQLNAGMALVDAPVRCLDAQGLATGLQLNAGQKLSLPSLSGRFTNGDRISVINQGDSTAIAVVTISPTKPLLADGEYQAGELGVMVGYVGSRSLARPSVAVLDYAGNAKDEWYWDGSLAMGDTLIVDGRGHGSVMLETTESRDSGFDLWSIRHGRGWTRLMPGSNTLELRGELDGPFGWFTINFWDTWVS